MVDWALKVDPMRYTVCVDAGVPAQRLLSPYAPAHSSPTRSVRATVMEGICPSSIPLRISTSSFGITRARAWEISSPSWAARSGWGDTPPETEVKTKRKRIVTDIRIPPARLDCIADLHGWDG